MSLEFQEAYYKQFVYESSYEEFMFSLSEANKHCQSMRNIPLAVLVTGKKSLLFARSTNEVVTIARRIITLIKQSYICNCRTKWSLYSKDEPHYIIDAVKWIIEVEER